MFVNKRHIFSLEVMHMTNEELNTALYKKMFAEQEKYKEWLLSLPPDEILNHAYNQRSGQSSFEVPLSSHGCVQGLGEKRNRPHG